MARQASKKDYVYCDHCGVFEAIKHLQSGGLFGKKGQRYCPHCEKQVTVEKPVGDDDAEEE